MKSIKVVDEFIIHPNTVRSLGVGQCVVIEKYPQAVSKIVRVRPEVSEEYLDDGEVRDLLKVMQRKPAAQINRLERLREKPVESEANEAES